MKFVIDMGTNSEVVLQKVRQFNPEVDPEERGKRAACDAMYTLVDRMADRDQLNEFMWHLFGDWNIDGTPEHLDGRSTWAMSWDDLQKIMLTAMVDDAMDSKGDQKVAVMALEDCQIVQAALKATGLNLDKVTWPGLQNVLKAALEPNMQYAVYKFDALNSNQALVMRKSGFVKKIRDMGGEKALDFLWRVYTRWPLQGEPQIVGSVNQSTWPLSFSALSVILEKVGWEEIGISMLEDALFKEKLSSNMAAHVSPSCVCWPDFQQVFREACQEADGESEWSEALDMKYPVLDKQLTLTGRVDEEQVKQLVEGEWRVYGIPAEKKGDDTTAFSYGITITDFDPATMAFKGTTNKVSANHEERYKIANGHVAARRKATMISSSTYSASGSTASQGTTIMTPKPAPSLSFSGMKKWPSYPEVKFFSKETTAWNHGIVKEANSKGDSVTIEFVPGGVVDGKKPSYTSLVPIESGRVVRKDTITPESFIIGYSISYEEVYPNGTKDKVVARLKSNGKFTCSSGSGYHMKAKRVDTMRGGETGPDKRYFTNCKDQDHHAHDRRE